MKFSLISYGLPRTGTTFIEKMFCDCEDMAGVRFFSTRSQVLTKEQMRKIFAERKKPVYFKVGEGSQWYPVNSQVNFNELMSIMPKPVRIMRTIRNLEDIYKSILYIESAGGEMYNTGRFYRWNIDSFISLVLAEFGTYLYLRKKYLTFNINFSKLENEKFEFLPENIREYCKEYISKNYKKNPVRKGRLSDNQDMEITESEKQKLSLMQDYLEVLEKNYGE